jgi:hypothetical protein
LGEAGPDGKDEGGRMKVEGEARHPSFVTAKLVTAKLVTGNLVTAELITSS